MEVFRYELCSIPPSLFESNGLPRPANKPLLADAIWKLLDNETVVPQGNMQFVLDGGALLQGLPWSKQNKIIISRSKSMAYRIKMYDHFLIILIMLIIQRYLRNYET